MMVSEAGREARTGIAQEDDRDTAQWSADSLGRSEVEEVAEGFSYGANTIRDGVSLTPKRELRALALASEIMRLENLSGYLRFPGPLPVAAIRLDYVDRPRAAERFVARDDAGEDAPGDAPDDGTGDGPKAEPSPALPKPNDGGPGRRCAGNGGGNRSGDAGPSGRAGILVADL